MTYRFVLFGRWLVVVRTKPNAISTWWILLAMALGAVCGILLAS